MPRVLHGTRSPPANRQPPPVQACCPKCQGIARPSLIPRVPRSIHCRPSRTIGGQSIGCRPKAIKPVNCTRVSMRAGSRCTDQFSLSRKSNAARQRVREPIKVCRNAVAALRPTCCADTAGIGHQRTSPPRKTSPRSPPKGGGARPETPTSNENTAPASGCSRSSAAVSRTRAEVT